MFNLLEKLTGLDKDYYVFLFCFFGILIVPYNIFFILRDYFSSFLTSGQADTYSIICIVIIIWFFIIFYIIYYFYVDFKSVYNNIKEAEKKKLIKENSEKIENKDKNE